MRKARKIIGSILLILAVLFTVYLSVIMIIRINAVVRKADYVKIFCYELVVCACFILLTLDIRFGFTRMKSKVLKVLGWCLRVIVILMSAVFLFFIGKITIGGFIHTEGSAKHAIVLGLALEKGQPTKDLLSRLDTAKKYLQEHPDVTLILTGGNPDESGRTEAAVMQEILRGQGVADDQMILEDQAANTKDNFKNTAQFLGPDESVALISSNYHMDRAVKTAQDAGINNILRVPAPSSPLFFGANIVWEVILEINDMAFHAA